MSDPPNSETIRKAAKGAIEDVRASDSGGSFIFWEILIVGAIAGLNAKSWWVAAGAMALCFVLFMIPKINVALAVLFSGFWFLLVHSFLASLFMDQILWRNLDVMLSTHALPWIVSVPVFVISLFAHLAVFDD